MQSDLAISSFLKGMLHSNYVSRITTKDPASPECLLYKGWIVLINVDDRRQTPTANVHCEGRAPTAFTPVRDDKDVELLKDLCSTLSTCGQASNGTT